MTDLRTPTPVDLPVFLPSPAPSTPEEALSWLGDTVEEVAEGLRAWGIKGSHFMPNQTCPLARYLKIWWPGASVAIGGWAIYADNGGYVASGPCPSACAEFEYLFDEYNFPDLID